MKKMIAGNWKMFKTADEAVVFIDKLTGTDLPDRYIDIVIFPPFLAIPAMAADARVSAMGIYIGAQNGYWEPEGPYTGEVSLKMIREAGCRYVVLGHSERRAMLGETDETVNKKVKEAVRVGLIPVVCVGETAEQRQGGMTDSVVTNQIQEALADTEISGGDQLVIAYEPVWAIGSGTPATFEDAGRVHRIIRSTLAEKYGEKWSQTVRILYGGSVKPDNILDYMQVEGIDGALIGGASLQPQSFVDIVKKAAERRL